MTEAIIEGSVSIKNKEIVELLKQRNELLKHQNTILSNMYDLMRARP